MWSTRSRIHLFAAAHTVVIKGVKIFQNNANKEYSDLDVMQMLGRAGRPQFGNLPSGGQMYCF